MNRIGKSIRVTGKVQGVWFRQSTQLQAKALDITGWVRNEADGSVLIHAFGAMDKLKLLEQWCEEGPPHAKVGSVHSESIPLEDHNDFVVRR